jgi:uncharacterized protein
MKELLEYIVKSIVNNPDKVEISERESVDFPGLTILTINVAEEDIGIVIGKRGRTINAIRDIISINAIRSKKRVRVNLEENKEEQPPSAEIETEKDEDILNDEM